MCRGYLSSFGGCCSHEEVLAGIESLGLADILRLGTRTALELVEGGRRPWRGASVTRAADTGRRRRSRSDLAEHGSCQIAGARGWRLGCDSGLVLLSKALDSAAAQDDAGKQEHHKSKHRQRNLPEGDDQYEEQQAEDEEAPSSARVATCLILRSALAPSRVAATADENWADTCTESATSARSNAERPSPNCDPHGNPQIHSG